MKKILFKGCGTAVCTPFDSTGINMQEFKKLIEFQISNNIDSIIVCGTTGESSTLNDKEKTQLIKSAVKISNGKIPIIVGTGSNDTKQTIINSKHAQNLGADGLLIVTPYYNKCTQDGLINHYNEIAKNTSLPIIIYNVPTRTCVNIEPKTCFKLSKIENIVGIKESSGNISQITQIASLCGDNLPIYSGNDDQILPILSIGGIGVISVVSNILPKYTYDLVNYFFDGNITKSRKMQLKLLPLANSLFLEVNPIPIKSALNDIGFNFGEPRLPLTNISNKNYRLLKKEMSKFSELNLF